MNAGNKSKMHNIRFTPAELEALRMVAEERSCGVGAVVRWAVRKYLAQEIADIESRNPAVHTNGATKENA